MADELQAPEAQHVAPLAQLCRELCERSPEPMAAVDGPTQLVLYANPAFARLVAREVKQLVGRSFAEAVPDGDRNERLALLDRVFRSGTPANLPQHEHDPSQAPSANWSYAMWPLLGADDQPVGVMVQVAGVQVAGAAESPIVPQRPAAMDESLPSAAAPQRELAEPAASPTPRRQPAVRARGQFLGVLSHELRNPLTAITSALEVLRLSGSDPDAAANSRQIMERQLSHMVRLVDDLLDVSRIATGELDLDKQQVELAAVIQNAVETSRGLLDAKGLQLSVALPSGPVVLDADPARLAHVFANLLSSAAKSSEPRQKIQLSARLDGGEVEVSIQDQGIGISAATLPHIFQTFAEADATWAQTPAGMGLGLSLVKPVVQLHGGRVEARSGGLRKGSELLVRLPIAQHDEPKPAAAAEPAPRTRRRILVADDNREAATSLATIFEVMGHEVRTAADGEAAVAAAADFSPDLVLMDLGMPNVDGYEAARRMRRLPAGADLYLVALTGWGAEEDRLRTEAAGFDAHILKPLDIATIKRLIAQCSASEADPGTPG